MSKLVSPIGPNDHVIGPPTGVPLVEYGDYECPFCGRAHREVQTVLRRLEGDVRYAFRSFPLAEAHPHALLAAQAAEAAGAQEMFWPMHDMLFENQNALELEDLVAYAKALGLDVVRFENDLEMETHIPKIKEDFRSGVRSGVNGTPTFFIEGLRFNGPWDADSLTAALRDATSSRQVIHR